MDELSIEFNSVLHDCNILPISGKSSDSVEVFLR